MLNTDAVSNALQAWAPELENNFYSLGYLGNETALKWLNGAETSLNFSRLIHVDGCGTASKLWRKVIKDHLNLPTPALLLVLEHLRVAPALMGRELSAIGLEFSKSLAYTAFRAAEALYEEAKDSFSSDEIDVALARFKISVSEFRFSIESSQLTPATRRLATGKYAAAVAMIGRWANVSPAAVFRALAYSQDSMALGNQTPEMLVYRIELLILQYDQTSNADLLREALTLVSSNPKIADGSELAEAEVRLRLAQATADSREVRRYLSSAELKLRQFSAKNGVEEARRVVLSTLIEEIKAQRLSIAATSIAIPRGLLLLMATNPSQNLWAVTRRVIGKLEQLRVSRGWVPMGVLSARIFRQIINGPAELLLTEDLEQYATITDWLAKRSQWNRHVQWEAGAVALSVAKRSNNESLAFEALARFQVLAQSHPAWPLPLIGIARSHDYLSTRSTEYSSIASDSWKDAATLALKSASYERWNLGGRNEVFSVQDARGFLSEAFVFKRTSKAKAEYEASMLNILREEIERQNKTLKFEVPRSLAIVEVQAEDERRWVHVTQRAAGRLVSELSDEEAQGVLEPIVDFLAIFHRIAGRTEAGRSGWGPLKKNLKMWSRTLFAPSQVDSFVTLLGQTFPSKLPLVRKRDAHASNWLVDPIGRIVAIDLESSEFIPLGYDVAQLIEDHALIPASLDGWNLRITLFSRYLKGMQLTLDEKDVGTAYGWFALTRALRLGTEKQAGKQLKRHARELCALVGEQGQETIKKIALELQQALSRIEHPDSDESKPSHDHRRLSKSLAFQLRHHAPASGVAVDTAGFAKLEEVAALLSVSTGQLLAVVEHPGEPRFQVQDGYIRALYGHSLDVHIDAGMKIETPPLLYHGSSWSVIDAIVNTGITPMGRRVVHLTNLAVEAMAVGERKGSPIVFAIAKDSDEKPVADGIWVTPSIAPIRLSIINPFSDEIGTNR